MPFFDYRAIDQTGRSVKGVLSAVNDVDLELRLKRMGLDLITLSELSRQYAPQGRERVTRRDLVTFCIHMRYITRAGIPLLDGLRDLRDTMEKRGFRDVLTALLEDLEGGKVLSQALAAHPAVFGEVFVHSIRAGEQTGLLDAVFERLAESLKWQEEVAAKAKRLMVYPALVLVVVGAAILFLLVYLVPQVLALVETMGVQLPLPTLVLMAVSSALRSYWLIALLLALAVGGGLPLWVQKSEPGRDWWDRTQLKLPVIGPIVQKIVLSRFTNTLAMMYRSGVTVLDALRAGEKVAGNREIASGIHRADRRRTRPVREFPVDGLVPAAGHPHVAGGRDHRGARRSAGQRDVFLQPGSARFDRERPQGSGTAAHRDSRPAAGRHSGVGAAADL